MWLIRHRRKTMRAPALPDAGAMLETSQRRLEEATRSRVVQERLRDQENEGVRAQISRIQERNDLRHVFRVIFGEGNHA